MPVMKSADGSGCDRSGPASQKKTAHEGIQPGSVSGVQDRRKLQIPVSGEILLKVRNTRSQKKLAASARRNNLIRAFRAAKDLTGLTVLVVDDVYTTGATMDAAAACLKRAGAEKVYFVALCAGQI